MSSDEGGERPGPGLTPAPEQERGPEPQDASVRRFLDGCVALDLELRNDDAIGHLGAVRGDQSLHLRQTGGLDAALHQLDAFASGARYLLGHNLLGHDLPALRRVAPDLRLLSLPVVDTLYLSPLAFPQNPYHRLVKDYKLVKDCVNDPVADARLAMRVFVEQWEAFATQAEIPGLLSLYRHCFAEASLGGQPGDGAGLAKAFAAMGVEPLAAGPEAAREAFLALASGLACPAAARRVADERLARAEGRPALAYVAAWLRVAGGDSVLPSWVRHRFADIPAMLDVLREQSCGDADCSYCADNHDPDRYLQRFFGFEQYRPMADGTPLQRQIVQTGMGQAPLLAILPTGGGKSLCYQVPALVRFQRRGVLTLVISPLQALMKDQVDNLCAKTQTYAAAAICGMLTPPERGDALERVRLGSAAILYVSPEQLRNRSLREAISQREIGCWVFDEAHCVSKWGHDFRPDYLFASRFIRELAEQQRQPPPPVACFTATAKQDVIDEIVQHFEEGLGQRLQVFRGGLERENLHFEVQSITRASKNQHIDDLLRERLEGGGAVLVYCATRRGSEEVAEYLVAAGWRVEAFHAGLSAPDKRRIQDAFVAGDLQGVCATNAFGMGIDKANVRLVVHADIPGSLENYLQEAGRAGRDMAAAQCVLLYDEEDIETQFKLGAMSRLSQRDIQQILRGLRRARRDSDGNVVLTAGELLSDEAVDTDFDPSVADATTRVRTAIAWLERAGFVQRNENQTRVFQGRPLVRTAEEARAKMDALGLPAATRRRWEVILDALIQSRPDDGMSADDLAILPGVTPEPHGRAVHEDEPQSQRVLRTLHEMSKAGLVERSARLTAYVRPAGKGSARPALERICAVERAMLKLMQEESPEDDGSTSHVLSLRRLNQRLNDDDPALGVSPELLRSLLKGLSQDGRGLAGSRASLLLKYLNRDGYAVRLQRRWLDVLRTAELRRAVAGVALEVLCTAARAQAQAGSRGQEEVLVSFSLEEIVTAVGRDLALSTTLRDPLAATERALMFMHENRVIILQHGLAVFRQAMTVRVLEEAGRRRYARGDFAPLAKHYEERTFQVHVMDLYARLGLERIGRALRFVAAYFTLGRKELVKRYFADSKDQLARATSAESFRRIVEALGNPEQVAVVAATQTRNALVLAGPGAGKTRVVVHRAAYLLRVQRVSASSILMLAFNHSAALALRRRLCDLVGDDARGVTILTYHGLAMLLLGVSFAARAERGARDEADVQQQLDHLIPAATALLRGEGDAGGMHSDAARERLLAGYRFVLVDEYQDIDQAQYDLVSALAGRAEQDPEGKLNLLAVGDDDQSIYGFRRSSVRFIRQFQDDYDAQVHHLVDNYRSTQHIIDAANALISRNRDRMKTAHPIRIDRNRRQQPPGGSWTDRDPITLGRVQILQVADRQQQAAAIVEELLRMRALDEQASWGCFAVLARRGMKHSELADVRCLLEHRGIPVSWKIEPEAAFPLHRVRELDRFLALLVERRDEYLAASDLIVLAQTSAANPWSMLLLELLEAWRAETADAKASVLQAREFLFEALAERRREQRLGAGVFLGTVHGAKGMEFDHVVVADGGWRREADASAAEEERRLFYVAMTRARHTLTLTQQPRSDNPHLEPLADCAASVVRRQGQTVQGWPSGLPHLRYELLGLKQVYLDYAGCHPEGHALHTRLSELSAGDPVTLAYRGRTCFLHSEAGHPVARLSEAFAARSRADSDATGSPVAARVVAMLRRRTADARDERFRARHRCEVWEIPVVELAGRV